MPSAIYEGTVVHARLRPKRHKLSYRVFSLLVDLDELGDLDRGRALGVNRRAPISFWEKDHGAGAPRGLRSWVEAELGRHGLSSGAAKIQMLCYPRILGYVFNPLTVYFCSDESGQLRAVVYEVNNTFGERHSYALAASGDGVVNQRCRKVLRVSPFIPMACEYAFAITPPAKEVAIRIDEFDQNGLLLKASFVGRHRSISEQSLRRLLLKYPLMTVKVMTAIHWEALRLWLRGVPIVRRLRPASLGRF